jgi:hypothetical protein
MSEGTSTEISALGLFNHDPEWLVLGAVYLAKHHPDKREKLITLLRDALAESA